MADENEAHHDTAKSSWPPGKPGGRGGVPHGQCMCCIYQCQQLTHTYPVTTIGHAKKYYLMLIHNFTVFNICFSEVPPIL